MDERSQYSKTLPQDFTAGIVVFLVALPLCLGIALASQAPLLSGLVAGVVGGLLVVWLSGSHTSVSGPAAGLTAVVASQIETLGSFEAFLVAVMLAGVLQIGLGLFRAGALAVFFPSSVIKGLLAAIGVILILKQIPHLFGHDADWLGDMSFRQVDGLNTFTELAATVFDVHAGATIVGLSSLALLLLWDRTPLRRLPVPGPLAVVVGGVLLALGLDGVGGPWAVTGSHLVEVPVTDSWAGLARALPSPDYSALGDPKIAVAAFTVALVASLETLLNLEAVDKLDPQKRVSPPNRELLAQGVGNVTAGALGGLPITSVIVRSSVGITSGGKTRLTCFVHGVLLAGLVISAPGLLNLIPLSCLAAVLMVTGFKLANPKLFRQMWADGRNQFLPFFVTVAAIVLTDLLIGILIGLAVALVFILQSNLRSPLRRIAERHVGGEVMRVELGNHLSFLNRASLIELLHGMPHGSHVVLDARNTVYMDHDIRDLVREFETEIAPAHDIDVSLVGFRDRYDFDDRITYVDVTTREVQDQATPEDVLQMLVDGNERFVRGQPVTRDPRRHVDGTQNDHYPLAVVLACTDARIATEMIFDVGLGDLFSVRVAGNVASEEALGSMEYGCAMAGAKLLLVLGHTRCGAVTATVDHVVRGPAALAPGDLENLGTITGPIAESVGAENETVSERHAGNREFVERVTVLNVRRTMREIRDRSATLRRMMDEGKLLLAGGVYDVGTGHVKLLDPEP